MRLRLAAGARLASRQVVAEDARRGPASDPPAVGIYPRTFLRLDPADGGAGGSKPRARRHALDRLRPHPVRERLSALGFRRSGYGDPAKPHRRAAPDDLCRQCADGVSAGLKSPVEHVKELPGHSPQPAPSPRLPSGRLRPSEPVIGPAKGRTRWTGYGEGAGRKAQTRGAPPSPRPSPPFGGR